MLGRCYWLTGQFWATGKKKTASTSGQKDSPLSFPNGFAARDGAIYVSNWSVAPARTGLGQVARISTH
jgi:hypothetical protein